MPRFAQHTRLTAAPGRRDALVAKFLEAASLQAGNEACELMLVSVAPDDADVVYLTEVWTSAERWEQARESDEIKAWSASMPALVAGPPESTPLEIAGGTGLDDA
jgi:quinol monooxygenase YgiN